jgi:DNA-directed RNA polymerase subunit N (RpoN/RPB10)
MFQYEVFPYGEVSSTSVIAVDPVWKNYFHWLAFKKILDEVGLSQYSCNRKYFVLKHINYTYRCCCENSVK